MIQINITQKQLNNLVERSKECKSKLGSLLCSIRHNYSNYDKQLSLLGFRTANEELEIETLKLFPNPKAQEQIIKHFDNKFKREEIRI